MLKKQAAAILLAVTMCTTAVLAGNFTVHAEEMQELEGEQVYVADSYIESVVSDEKGAEYYEYAELEDGTIRITGYHGSGGDVTIPSQIDGKSVTNIGKSAFSGCSSLASVTIPGSVSVIQYGAFRDCNNLSSAEIAEGVECIGEYAFGDCSSLTSVNVPKSVTEIGYGAFEGCTRLVLQVVKGSYAETYAKANNIKYQYAGAAGECVHNYTSKITTAPTCTAKGIKTYTCTKCGDTYTEEIPAAGHTYAATTTPATTKKNGSITKKCTVCGAVKSKKTIYAAKTIKLSQTSFTYTGRVQKPSVTIRDSKGKALKSNTDYTVTYPKGMKNVGSYTVTVKFKGNYIGTVKKTFTITPKPTSISKVTAKSKGLTVKWKKQASQTTGYEIAYSTSSKFTKKTTKTVTVSKNKTVSKSVSKLKAKKKYYVRIRTYKTVKVNGKSTKLYSNWSKAKNITTKK